MASKPDVLSGETCQLTSLSQQSVTKGDVVTPKSILSDNLELNEQSNQLGDSSSSDSLSKRTQSKVTFSASATCNASIGEMLPKVSSSAILEDHLTSRVDQRPKGERHSSSEDNGDNYLSVNVVNDASIVGDQCSDKLVTANPFKNLDNSGVSPRVDADRSVGSDPNVKLEPNKDYDQLHNEVQKCSDDDEKVEKSKSLAVCVDTQDPPVHSTSSDENDDSDIVEQDVKVCDICGDAGREDLLAICSRCSDGAEHTYCMREMLSKVPEGDWLCEECKMAEETESQKQEILGKRASKGYLGTRGSGKRRAEDFDVTPVSKKQAMGVGKGSSKILSPSKIGVPSKDNSFENTEKGKVRLSSQASSLTNHMSRISSDGGPTPSTGSHINPFKGKLSKSSSFNTVLRPKVKPMDEVPHRKNGTRESILPDKEGRTRAIGKSTSFKSSSSDRPNSTQSKVTSPSLKPGVQDFKGLKSPKDSSFERKSLPRLDHSLSSSSKSNAPVSASNTSKNEQKLTPRPRGEIASISSANNNRSFKSYKSDGTLLASKSTSQMVRKGSDAVITPVGVSSTSEFSASVEKRLNNTNQDEPSSSSSWNSDRAVNNSNELPRSRESSQVDKCRENKSDPLKQSGTSSRTIARQRCSDVGHDAESCSLSSPSARGLSSSTARSSGEESNEGNKLKAAITAAMLKKPGIYRRRQLEKSSELATSNVETRSPVPSHDHSSLHNSSSTDVQETQKLSQGCSSDSHKAGSTNNAKQFAGQPVETMLSSKMTDSDSIIRSNGYPIIRDRHMNTSAVPLFHLKTLTIPEHEYIWQGAFQVCRGGIISALCDGMQAHLSSSASPKVVEAVDRFPQKILFDEVPRLSTWPSQFNANGAREDNIALYFFAKDIESYERNYKTLLENMIKNDLALKGEINGVELLIFSSNWLPESSQRWNMLHFLWGVFRGRRGMDQTSEANLQISSMNMVHLDRKPPPVVSSYSQSISSLKSEDKGLSPGTAVNVVLARDCYLSAQSPISSSLSGIAKGVSEPLASQFNHKNKSLEAILKQQNSASGTCSAPEFLPGSVQSHTEIERPKKAMNGTKFQECERDAQFQQSVEPPGTRDSPRLEEMFHVEMQEAKDSLCHPAKIFPIDSGEIGAGMNATEDKIVSLKEDKDLILCNPLEKDLTVESNHQQNKRKYVHTVPEETILRTFDGSNNMQWNDGIKSAFKGHSPGKKLKSDISGMSVHKRLQTEASICDKVATSSMENRSGGVCDVKCTSKEFGTTERYLFPLDSAFGNRLQLEDDSMRWKACESETERFLGGFPNLELALGADTIAPNNGIQPLIPGVSDDRHKEKPQDKVLLKEEEDVSASLSLSLSFPFPDQEHAVKPITNAEQALPEKHQVDTSLLLFGAPGEK